MKEIQVTAVIITYRRPLKILSRAIHSVLKQTYSNLELLVVNDAPEDKQLSYDIAQYINDLHDQRVRYIVHEKNKGANEARNTGLINAAGEYIAYLDDDDEWLPEKIEKQLQIMTSDPGVGLVHCGFYIRNGNEDRTKKAEIHERYLPYLVESNYIGSTSFPMLRTDFVRDLGGFDVNQKSCQEYELWLRIARSHKVVGIDLPLGIYYVSSDSTFKGNYEKYEQGDNSVVKKNIDIFKKYPIRFGNHYLHMFSYMIMQKQIKRAMAYKIKAFKACWYNPNNITLFFVLYQIWRRRGQK